MEAGLDSVFFWGALSFALAVAFVVALPVNRWLIARGQGPRRRPPHRHPRRARPKLVGAVLAVAFVFGATVLIAEALDTDDPEHVDGPHAAIVRNLPA